MVSGGCCGGALPDTVCWTRLRNTWGYPPPPPGRNFHINNSLRVILCNCPGLFTYVLWCDSKDWVPQKFLCDFRPHPVHRQSRLSKCKLLTHNGLHFNNAMNRKYISPDFLYVIILRGGVVIILFPMAIRRININWRIPLRTKRLPN